MIHTDNIIERHPMKSIIKVKSKVKIIAGSDVGCYGVVKHIVETTCKTPYVITYKDRNGSEVIKAYKFSDLRCLDKPVSKFD